jgi:nucleotide-binding universal stress UspA family protein
MSSSIVCAFDETSGSRHAASIAARLARDLDSPAVLVYPSEPLGLLRLMPPASLGRTRRLRRSLATAADEHGFPDGTVIRVKAGDPAETLIAIAEAEDAELIVVAARGRSTLSSALLDRAATGLMRDSPCPVVVVPPDTVAPLDSEGMKAVVCGVAGDDTDPEVLRLAEDLALRLAGGLHAVHAYDPRGIDPPVAVAPGPPIDEGLADAANETVVGALERAGVYASAHIVPLPAARALEEVAEKHRAGLIVVGSRGRGKLGSLLHGSVPVALAAEGRTSVVVLPLGTRIEPGSGHYEVAAGLG